MFKRRSSIRGVGTATVRKLFHGVAITVPEACRCRAALAVAGHRFLADDAPLLPLEGCEYPSECRCTYRHYDDRRSAARRESDLGLPSRAYPQDARRGAGRRITDG